MGEIRIELEREEDGRWIAEITAVPGVPWPTAKRPTMPCRKSASSFFRSWTSAFPPEGITEQEAAEALKGLAA